MAQKPLDGESNATVCHDREKVTSVSVNNIPKTKLVLQAAGDQGDRTCCWGGTYPRRPSLCKRVLVSVSYLQKWKCHCGSARPITTSRCHFHTFYRHFNHINQFRYFLPSSDSSFTVWNTGMPIDEVLAIFASFSVSIVIPLS